MSAHCVSCGSPERLTDTITSGGVELTTAYCGACGATWGYRCKPAGQPQRTQRMATQGASAGFEQVRGLGKTFRRSMGAKPFASVADTLPKDWSDR